MDKLTKTNYYTVVHKSLSDINENDNNLIIHNDKVYKVLEKHKHFSTEECCHVITVTVQKCS